MADLLDAAVDLVGDLAAPYVLIAPVGRSIGGIVPNVTVQEVLIDESTITQFPVQSGAPITDHTFANPSVVEMICGWSDSTGRYTGYSVEAYNALLGLRDTRQPFDVYTGKRMYSNMLFSSIQVQTDDTGENVVMARFRLQQIRISNTAATGGNQGATDGNQAYPNETGPTTDRGTLALQSTGTESETAASAKGATIAGWSTPVTTPSAGVNDGFGGPSAPIGGAGGGIGSA